MKYDELLYILFVLPYLPLLALILVSIQAVFIGQPEVVKGYIRDIADIYGRRYRAYPRQFCVFVLLYIVATASITIRYHVEYRGNTEFAHDTWTGNNSKADIVCDLESS